MGKFGDLAKIPAPEVGVAAGKPGATGQCINRFPEFSLKAPP
jgi:hypothetical protein